MIFEFEITCICGNKNVKFVANNDVKNLPIFKCNKCNIIGNLNRFLYEIDSKTEE